MKDIDRGANGGLMSGLKHLFSGKKGTTESKIQSLKQVVSEVVIPAIDALNTSHAEGRADIHTGDGEVNGDSIHVKSFVAWDKNPQDHISVFGENRIAIDLSRTLQKETIATIEAGSKVDNVGGGWQKLPQKVAEVDITGLKPNEATEKLTQVINSMVESGDVSTGTSLADEMRRAAAIADYESKLNPYQQQLFHLRKSKGFEDK
jgi:hypothetical protein